MCMNRTVAVGRHGCVIPEAPGLLPWGVVTHFQAGKIPARGLEQLTKALNYAILISTVDAP
jgi:hypothetical protein